MAGAVERSVVARLRAEVGDYVRPMEQAAKATDKVTDATKRTGAQGRQSFSDVLTHIDKNSASLNKLSLQLGLVGAGMVGFAALAVKRFADFDEAMSGVAAATMESADNMALLRQAALEAGADTQYTATEAARAIRELAKAGVSTADILKGGLRGSLSLAASGQMELADAAAVTSTVMNQFRLTGDRASHIADVLAASAGKANGEVADFGLAMKYVGPIAAQLGVSLEETSGTLALLAQNGILADSAGTGLRGMLMSLTSPTKEAQKALDTYNITAFDARGEFVGLAPLVGQLHDRLGGLTEQERSAALGMIFGNNQITTARILYREGAGAVREWTDAVDDSGYAAEQARIQTDNLKGDLERLGGSFDTVLIQGGSGANDALRQIVQAAEAVVDAIGRIPAPVLGALTAITGTGGLAILGVAGLLKLATAAAEGKRALDTLHISAGKAKLAVAGVGTAIAIGTLAFVAWANAAADAKARVEGFMDTLDDMGQATDATLRKVNDRLAESNTRWYDFLDGTRDTRSAVEMAQTLGIAIEDVQGAILGQAEAQERVNAAMDHFLVRGRLYDPTVTSDERAAAEALNSIINEQAGAYSEAQKQAARKALADEAAGVAAEGAVPQIDAATQAILDQEAAQQAATEELEKWRQAVSDSNASFIDLGGLYQGIIDKNRQWAEEHAAATDTAEDDWQDYYDGVAVSAEAYIAGLQAQVDAQAAWETNILEISARVRDGMTGDMRTAAERMIDELINLGPEGAAQVQLLHDMSDEQFATVVALWSEKGTAAVTEFVSKVEGYRQPVIVPTVQMVAAENAMRDFVTVWNGKTITMNAAASVYSASGGLGFNPMTGKAEGGQIGGGVPGRDSVPIMAMPGEFMVRKSAVDSVEQAAPGFMAALNRQGAVALQGHAGGGSIGTYVAPARYAAPMWSGPAYTPPRSAAPDGGVTVSVDTIIATDPRAAAAELGHEMRFGFAGVSR